MRLGPNAALDQKSHNTNVVLGVMHDVTNNKEHLTCMCNEYVTADGKSQ